MRLELEDKVTKSQLLIRHAYRHASWQGAELECAYSGGKDSDVLLDLCRTSNPAVVVRPIHRCTTIDAPYTLRHCLDNGVEILRPRKNFAECIMQSGFPTMFVRHCCGELKEYAVLDYVLVGVRKSESVKRAKRYTCDEDLVTYNGRGRVMQYYPLLNWTDEDIAEYIQERGIKCHPLYYDEQGNFHVERRLGCCGCPLQYYKKRIEDFKRHPKFVRFWCRYGQRYLDTHPDVKTHEYFDDVFEWFTCNLFYKSIEEFRKQWPRRSEIGGGISLSLFDNAENRQTCKQFLESYFGISLDGL